MALEWDDNKNQINSEKHGIRFEALETFDWDMASIERSDRQSELGFAAIGYIGNRLHHVVFTFRGDNRRIISLRKANRRDQRKYEQ